jgi:flagellar hook-basal body complex protein FliE
MVIQPATSPTSVTSTPGVATTEKPDGNAFTNGLNQVEQSLNQADQLGQQLATGQLSDVHVYMAAASKAELAVQMTVAIRDRAVEAYQEIMRMQV